MQSTALPLRLTLLFAAAATAVMLLLRVSAYRPFLALPGAHTILVAALVPLLLCAIAFAWSHPMPRFELRPHFATVIGLIAATLQLTHLTLERFLTLPARADGAASIAFELITFSLWGYTAFTARRRGSSLLESLAAAVWSAAVTMTLAVAAGTLLELYIAPYPLEPMRAWGEFQRSGWSDLQAFAIANTMDPITSHLIGAPIAAIFFGLLGCAAARSLRRSSCSALSRVP